MESREHRELYSEYPVLENERIVLRKLSDEDADALRAFAGNGKVYRYLPTFLYEQKYADPREVIARMDAECFDTKESILLGVHLKGETPVRGEEPDAGSKREQAPGQNPDTGSKREQAPGQNPDTGSEAAPDAGPLIGIAEIYNYEAKKSKASIGIRLDDSCWGKGIASVAVHLLREYLTEQIGLRTITAHVMRENVASARTVLKNGFQNKYPGIYEDWGFPELCFTDKFVYKKEWHGKRLPAVDVEQFVMAYQIDQDRIRAMLPAGFESLRPVLRINVEIRNGNVIYIEFNTPVAADGRRGWLNIDYWKSSSGDDLHFFRSQKADAPCAAEAVTITAPFLEISFRGTGAAGGCPAEKDNEGCFFLGGDTEFRPAEKIEVDREFCACGFAWCFHEGDARGEGNGEMLPADPQPPAPRSDSQTLTARSNQLPVSSACQLHSLQNDRQPAPQPGHLPLTAEHAAAIPCLRVLGAYRVRFRRYDT